VSDEIVYEMVNGQIIEVSTARKAEIMAEREKALTVTNHYVNHYVNKRTAEYPSIGDQLDALWKGGDAAAEMLAKVQAVKTKYPKPE